MPLNVVFFKASRLVSTKTLLLKHDYRRQGFDDASCCFPMICRSGIQNIQGVGLVLELWSALHFLLSLLGKETEEGMCM